MGNITKETYKELLDEFIVDMKKIMKTNKAYAMMIIKTHEADMHRTHIGKIWRMLGKYPDVREDYGENLMGDMLTGDDNIWKTLYFTDKEMYEKYSDKLPQVYAMEEALVIAYACLKEK